MNQRRTTTYTAESRVRSFREVIRSMLTGIFRSRYIAYRLTVKDIKQQHSTTVLGTFWDLAEGFVFGMIFYYLGKNRIVNLGELDMHPALFIIFGLFSYISFSEAVKMSVNSLRSSANLLNQQHLPPEALFVATFFRVMFNSAFRIAILLAFSVVLGEFNPLGFVLFVVSYPALVLSGLAIGIFLAPFNAIYSDIGRATELVLIPLRYVSPVLYATQDRLPDLMNLLNPLNFLIMNLRLLATNGTTYELSATVVHLGILLSVFLIGWFIFHLSVPILAERL